MAFGADERGVSAVVGATLIFGFLVIFFALYQATVVPNQNEQVEFDHSQVVQRDMVDARNAILETKETGEDGYVTVTLGTTYPPRVLGINPPPVTGTLRTTANHSFAIRDSSGSLITGSVCPGDAVTRFLVYEPGYHAYASGPDVAYENSVVYEAFPTGNVLDSGQTLVQGDTINVVPLQGSYAESGLDTVAFEPRAGRLDSSRVDQPSIELPTRLSESDWEALLSGQVAAENVTVAPDGNVTIEPDGQFTLNCGPVGTNGVPSGGGRAGDDSDFNPAGPGSVRVVNGTFTTNQVVDVYLNNTASAATNVTEARFTFYYDGGANQRPSTLAITDPAIGTESVSLEVGGVARTLSPEIELPGRVEKHLEFEFDADVEQVDFFVVRLTFSNGGTGTYFVMVEQA